MFFKSNNIQMIGEYKQGKRMLAIDSFTNLEDVSSNNNLNNTLVTQLLH